MSSPYQVDIVLPIYNSMHHVRPCIQSVFQNSDVPYHLYLVDDGCDSYTQKELESLLSCYSSDLYTYVRNENNLGYLKTVNRGVQMGNSPYVITLNSDTVVTQGWLSGMLQPFQNDTKVGIVNPVSCWANWTLIPFPSGMDIHELTSFVREHGEQENKPIYNASGFCFAIRRDLLAEMGWIDEVYGRGYYEETDLCMKAIERGYKVVVSLSVFVYHYGWGSFQEEGRNEHMERNRSIFLKRHKNLFNKVERQFKQERPLQNLHKALHRYEAEFYPLRPQSLLLRKLQRYSLAALATTWLKRYSNRLFGTKFRTALQSKQGAVSIQHSYTMDVMPLTPQEQAQSAKIEGGLHKVTGSHTPTLCFAIPANLASSTKEPLCNIINQMILENLSAKLVTVGSDDTHLFQGYSLYFRPAMYKDALDSLKHLGSYDIAICHWSLLPLFMEWKSKHASSKLLVLLDTVHPRVMQQLSNYSEALSQTDGIVVPYTFMKQTLSSFHDNVIELPWGFYNDYFYVKSPKPEQPTTAIIPWVHDQAMGLTKLVQHLQDQYPELHIQLYGESSPSPSSPLSPLYVGALATSSERVKAFREAHFWISPSSSATYLNHAHEAFACGAIPLLPNHLATSLLGSDWAQRMPNEDAPLVAWSDLIQSMSLNNTEESKEPSLPNASQTTTLPDAAKRWIQQLTNGKSITGNTGRNVG